VTFGFFFADAGTAISGGAHLMGTGLVLGLVGWLGCAVGSATALEIPQEVRTSAKLQTNGVLRLLPVLLLAIGVAVAFAPSWDSYLLRTSAGAAQSFSEGDVFSNPGPVIAGNVAVMVAFVAVVGVACQWRRIPAAAALFAGALVPMVAQAISALVQLGQGVTPAMFGISPAAAHQAGLTISAGLTWTFWVYCALCVLLIAAGMSSFVTPRTLNQRAPSSGQAEFQMSPRQLM
jgi:hypothetical protein